MKRVVVERFGGPEVLRVVDDDDPDRVRARCASGFWPPACRSPMPSCAPARISAARSRRSRPATSSSASSRSSGPGCSRLREGDRVGSLTVWGANAERVCVPEAYAVEVPEDLDPAEVVSLVFPYMTAYQLLHRAAKAKSGETVLVHGAAGRVGTAVLELGALAGLRLYGTASARDRAAVERLGAVAIDYRNEDFLARVRELTGDGRGRRARRDRWRGVASFFPRAAARRRLVVFGRYATLAHGRKNWRAVIEWYAATASVALWGLLSPRRRVLAYRIQKLRVRAPGLVPGGLPRAARAASSWRDPPRRGRAPAAVRRSSRPRAARAVGGDGKARARAMSRGGRSQKAPDGEPQGRGGGSAGGERQWSGHPAHRGAVDPRGDRRRGAADGGVHPTRRLSRQLPSCPRRRPGAGGGSQLVTSLPANRAQAASQNTRA